MRLPSAARPLAALVDGCGTRPAARQTLLACFRPFIEHLASSSLSPKTIRKHVDNLWILGGEIIRDLLDVESDSTFDTGSERSEENRRRMAYLFVHGVYNLPNKNRPVCHKNGGHSYLSVYGRLRWNQLAQTITTGFGSMGQGRYVHPQRRRTITPHEAARLQTFPDWFDFGDRTKAANSRALMAGACPVRSSSCSSSIREGASRFASPASVSNLSR
jgi:site-specific DNA-cytosine methylase